MIKWLLKLMWFTIWGGWPKPIEQTVVTRVGGDSAKPVQFGRIVAQIFLNRYPDGRIEPKFRLRRVTTGKDGNSMVDNFYLKDVDDAIRALTRAKAWTMDYLEIE